MTTRSAAPNAGAACLRCGAERVGAWCGRCGLPEAARGQALAALPAVLAGAVIVAVGYALHPTAQSWLRLRGYDRDSIVSAVAYGVTSRFVDALPFAYALLAGSLVARVLHGLRAPGRLAVGASVALVWLALSSAVARIVGDPVVTSDAPLIAGLAVVGALLGSPALDLAAKRAPFRWLAPIAERTPWGVRLVVLVPLVSVTVVAGTTALILAVLAWCAVMMLIGLLQALFASKRDAREPESARAPVTAREPDPEPPPEPAVLFALDANMRIKEDGSIVRTGGFFEEPTDMRIKPDGTIVRTGGFFEEPTGLRIDADGNLMKQGGFFEEPVGVRIEKDGRVVKTGGFFEQPTDFVIDKDGRANATGGFFDRPAGFEVTEDGDVRERKEGGS